jgi:DNA-directed RNA polymerase specialized sigma24 family protein
MTLGKVTALVELIDEFEVVRPRLLALAHRVLGSVEDAVQTARLRAQTAHQAAVDTPTAWFTTVTARLCLDQLRLRERRGELPLLADSIPDGQLAADDEFLRRDESRARSGAAESAHLHAAGGLR